MAGALPTVNLFAFGTNFFVRKQSIDICLLDEEGYGNSGTH